MHEGMERKWHGMQIYYIFLLYNKQTSHYDIQTSNNLAAAARKAPPRAAVRRAGRPRAAFGAPPPRARRTLFYPSSAPEATRGCRRRQRCAASTRYSRPSHPCRCQAWRRTWSHPRLRPWLRQAQEEPAGLPRITLLRLRPYKLPRGYRGRCALCGACSLSWTSPTMRDIVQADRPTSNQTWRGRCSG